MNQVLNQIKLDKIRNDTIKEIEEAWKFNDKIACVRYPGFGKSYFVVKALIDKNKHKKFLILVHRRALKNTYIDNLKDYTNVKIDTYQKITVGNWDEEFYNNFDYIICDECHHLINNKWYLALENLLSINNCKLLGITANSNNGENLSITTTFDYITSSIDLSYAIDNELIFKPTYITAVPDIDDSYIKSLNLTPEMQKKYYEIDRYKIENLINVPKILKTHIQGNKLETNLKIICFVPRIATFETAKHCLMKWFNEAYPEKIINIYSMSSYEEPSENDYQFSQFKTLKTNNYIDIILTVNMLNEGIHIPEVSTCIFLRYTKSPVVYLQQLGRTLNNAQPVIFDLVGTYKRLSWIEKYMLDKNRSHRGINNPADNRKLILDKCILIDYTKEIMDILNSYKYSKLNVLSLTQENYLKENSINMYMEDVAKYLNTTLGAAKMILIRRNLHWRKHKAYEKYENYFSPEALKYLLNNNCSLSYEEIISYLKIDTSKKPYAYCSFREALHKHGIYTKHDRLNVKFDKEIVELRKNPKSLKETAAILKINEKGATNILSRNNIPFKRAHKKRIKMSSDDIKFLKNHPDKFTLEEIKKKYNFSVIGSARIFCQRNEIKYIEQYGRVRYDKNKIRFLQDHPNQYTLVEIADIIEYKSDIRHLYNWCRYNNIKYLKERK